MESIRKIVHTSLTVTAVLKDLTSAETQILSLKGPLLTLAFGMIEIDDAFL